MKFDYKKIQNNIEVKYQDSINKIKIISLLRFINFIFIIVSLGMTSVSNNYYYLAIIFIIIFIILIIIHDKYYQKKEYYETYINVLKSYELRITNKWDSLPNNGGEYINNDNINLQDLDIIGQHSLYQYLCSAKTLQGKELLYNSLNNTYLSCEELKTRNDIVKEFTENTDFILHFQIYLSKLEDNIDLKENIKYIDSKVPNHYFLPLTILGNSISIIALLLGITKLLPITYFYIIVIFKYMFSYLYGLFYKEYLNHIEILSKNASKLNSLLQYLSKCSFKNKRLQSIKDNASKSIITINKLDSIYTFSKLKDNFIANFIFNGIFTIDPYILYQYHNIDKNNSKYLKDTINDISYLECMISLSNIGIAKKYVCIPNRIEEANLDFKDLRHPLLNEDECIPNDYKNESIVNIITGSNMSGKTSFLRTIGINLILANAGTYTCASSFTSSYLKIFTSMRVQDDIEKGISTFYGELLRIKEAIEYEKENKPMIVFIDEIFKGTNYNDRILGASSVIKKLNKDNVILFITTHDFELCDNKEAKNYYFTEYYEKDNIKFDYKIRKGKCNTTNAKYLMKRLNIIDDE